jgi:ABC-type glycerol-3-phosphate transport system substrate-binding protein
MLRPFLVAVSFLLLSACTANPPSPLPIAPTGVAPMTLVFWHTQTGNDAALLSTLAADFHTAYPSITVNSEAKKDQGDLLRQGIAALAMNQLPDFVIADRRTIGEFARQNALVALDPLIGDPTLGLAANDRADFLPGLLDSGRFPDLQNQLFAFPFDESAVVFYFNLDLLKSAKLDPPRTWDQFGAAARATTKGSAHGWVMAPEAPTFYAFLVSRGSRALSDDQTQVAFNDDGGTKMLQLIAALSKGGSAYLVDNADSARADFAQGKAALLFDTTDDLAKVSQALTQAGSGFQWGVAGIPQDDPTHPLTAIDGSDIAIFSSSPARTRAAWLFARWLTEPPQTARWTRVTQGIPLRTSAIPLLASSTPDPLFQRLRDGFGDTLPSGRPIPAVKDAAQIDAAMVEMWIAVANGTDPAAALTRATTRVTRILGP